MTKMKAHPSAMRRICHHSSLRETVGGGAVGLVRPVMVGRGDAEAVPEGLGATTSSLKHTPRPEMTDPPDPSVEQGASTHFPVRKT